MDFLKSGLKTVLGSPEPGQQPSPAETVERLVERAAQSTLLEDRRDACRALKAMSRKYRVEVGAQAMDTLKQVLELDRVDNETVNYALDTLNNIVAPQPFDEEQDSPHVPLNIGEQFTEMFIKRQDNVQVVLDLLEEYDFRVRLSAVQLLISLLENRPRDIQEIILVKPMGVSKMMDLLGDTREVIRNEALLLLIRLTKGNANIQKIVAFENAFDRLFEIVSSEGFSEGGIIVEDCLLLMLNLLKNNSSNINFFKEGSYIQKMLPMFSTPSTEEEEIGWSPQKVSNVHCMLQIIRTLVSPSNSVQIISSCQKIMKNAGLLNSLCNILMASGVPADILTETIATVGEVVRGDAANQAFLARVMAPSNPPRPALVVLLMSMVNEKQPFPLRCAVLYCFQCYLHRNGVGQGELVSTLLPSSADLTSLSAGQLLAGGLFSSDALSNWFSAVGLMHALIDNPQQKSQLLRVLLAPSLGAAPVSLLHHCALLLLNTTKLLTKVSLLMLLSQWVCECPAAVSALLRVPGALPHLVTLSGGGSGSGSSEHDDGETLLQGLSAFLLALCVQYSEESAGGAESAGGEGGEGGEAGRGGEALRQLVRRTLGLDTFLASLGEVSKHELYSKAAKHPQLRVKSASEVLLDYEFCRLFKVMESKVSSSVAGAAAAAADGGSAAPLAQHRLLIRQQDLRLQELLREAARLHRAHAATQAALSECQATNAALSDENSALRAQLAVSTAATTAATAANDKTMEYESRIQQLTAELNAAREQQAKEAAARRRLQRDLDDLLELLADQDQQLNEMKMRLLSLGQSVDEPAAEQPNQPDQLVSGSDQPSQLASISDLPNQLASDQLSQLASASDQPNQLPSASDQPNQLPSATDQPSQLASVTDQPNQLASATDQHAQHTLPQYTRASADSLT